MAKRTTKSAVEATPKGITTFVSADWHLDWHTAGVERFTDVTRTLVEELFPAICKRAEKGPTQFVFVGDLCEDQPGRGATSGGILRAIEFACGFRARLESHGVPSFWLTGNHDVAEDGLLKSTLSPIAGPLAVDYPGGFGSDFFALPYTSRDRTYSPGEAVRKAAERGVVPRAVFGHLNVEGITPGSEATDMPRGRDVFWPIDELRQCWPGVVCIGGHIHRALQVKSYNPIEIVGAPARFTFGEESNEPGYLILESDNTVRRVKFKMARRLITVDAAEVEKLKEGPADQIARVRCKGSPEKARDAEVAAMAHATAVKVVREDDAPTQVAQPRTEPRKGNREAVLEVARMVASADKNALLEHVSGCLDAEGVA